MIAYRQFDHFIFRVINSLLFTKVFKIIVLLSLPLLCLGNSDDQKSYYVKPIDFVCDYPFNDTTKWAVTCRVWGLLKYFHPNVTAGHFDWDKVLIDRIAKINEAKSAEQVNEELMQMIRIAGAYEMSIDTAWNDSLNMNVSLCWLDQSFINDSIRRMLREIASLTTVNHWYYVKYKESADKLPIYNEKDYENNVIDQYEYRLLALFRYWNVIYYFFPYKYMMDQSWDVTLLKFIPLFLIANDVSTYQNTVGQLATRLNDGHGFTSVTPYYDQFKYRYITKIDSLTVVRNPPESSALERGDIILSINKKNINSYRDSISVLIPSSNMRFTDNAVNGIIYWTIMGGCSLTILRNQKEISFSEYTKRSSVITPLSPYRSISSEIGYVNLDSLKSFDIPSIIDSMNLKKGVILDLRNYPIHFKFRDLSCHLIQTKEYCYALSTVADWSHIGAFYKEECVTRCPDSLWQDRKQVTCKIAVLINEATQSWAETLSMDFRTNGYTLVGAPTAGANGNATIFSLPGNIKVSYSGLGFYFPDGTQMQRTGIIPDIEVYPTMDDILAGRDEVLEAAITYLNSN